MMNANLGISPAATDRATARLGVAPAGPNSSRARRRLVPLRAIASDRAPRVVDVRGWRVAARDGAIIGSVIRIILDADRNFQARYIDVLLDPMLTGSTTGTDRRGSFDSVLIPIGRVDIASDRRGLVLPTLTPGMVAALPRLPNGIISWAFEQRLAASVESLDVESRDALYDHAIYSSAMIAAPVSATS